MKRLLQTSGLATLGFARRATLGFLEDIPEAKLCYQPFSGANHALWIIGHVACTDNYFLSSVGGRETDFPAAWNELFGMGATVQTDAAAYPALGEVRGQLDSRREDLIAWFKSLDEEQLAAPLPADFQTFAPSHAALINSIAWHEGLHAGQLTVIRKALGLGPKFR